MAREIHAREDLLRDAVALVPRAMFRLPLDDREVQLFAGFRGDALSLYFGEDPVYHFNSRGELRRAYADDCLIKAERSRLVELRRRKSNDEILLERREMDASDEAEFVHALHDRLAGVAHALNSGACQMIGQEPPDCDLLERLQRWLMTHPRPAIANSLRD